MVAFARKAGLSFARMTAANKIKTLPVRYTIPTLVNSPRMRGHPTRYPPPPLSLLFPLLLLSFSSFSSLQSASSDLSVPTLSSPFAIVGCEQQHEKEQNKKKKP